MDPNQVNQNPDPMGGVNPGVPVTDPMGAPAPMPEPVTPQVPPVAPVEPVEPVVPQVPEPVVPSVPEPVAPVESTPTVEEQPVSPVMPMPDAPQGGDMGGGSVPPTTPPTGV